MSSTHFKHNKSRFILKCYLDNVKFILLQDFPSHGESRIHSYYGSVHLAKLAAINLRDWLNDLSDFYTLEKLKEKEKKSIIDEELKSGESVVELSINTVNTGFYEPSTYLALSIISFNIYKISILCSGSPRAAR